MTENDRRNGERRLNQRKVQVEFQGGLTRAHQALMDVVRAAHTDAIRAAASGRGKTHEQIASAMDLSPSELNRKLKEYDSDTRRFNARDLEDFIAATEPYGLSVIHWLVERFLDAKEDRQARARDTINTLLPTLIAALDEAGIQSPEIQKLRAVK